MTTSLSSVLTKSDTTHISRVKPNRGETATTCREGMSHACRKRLENQTIAVAHTTE